MLWNIIPYTLHNNSVFYFRKFNMHKDTASDPALQTGKELVKKIIDKYCKGAEYGFAPVNPYMPEGIVLYGVEPDNTVTRYIYINHKALVSHDVLEFVTLHEIGHYFHRDTSKFTYAYASDPKNSDEHNFSNYDENEEFAADDFVIKALGVKKAYALIRLYFEKYGKGLFENEKTTEDVAAFGYQKLEDRVLRVKKLMATNSL